MYPILYKLSETIFMYIDATRLAVVYVTFHNSRIGACLHLKTGNSVIMDVVLLKVTLYKKRK